MGYFCKHFAASLQDCFRVRFYMCQNCYGAEKVKKHCYTQLPLQAKTYFALSPLTQSFLNPESHVLFPQTKVSVGHHQLQVTTTPGPFLAVWVFPLFRLNSLSNSPFRRLMRPRSRARLRQFITEPRACVCASVFCRIRTGVDVCVSTLRTIERIPGKSSPS